MHESVAHHHDFDDEGGLILHERSPINPKSIYATSKVAADFLTMNYHDAFGLPGVVTRMFNNYGPRQNPRYVTGTIITQALTRETVELGQLEPMRDFCFCTDGVRGHLTVAARGIPGDLYVYGQGKNISMREWAELILRVGREQGYWEAREIVSRAERFRAGSERSHVAARRLREAQPRDRLGAARLLGRRRRTDDRVVCREPAALDRPRRLAVADARSRMKTLVTGGGGFLGSHLVERLEADGDDVFVARRADYDLTKWDDAERLFNDARPERVFHLAGEVGGIGANRVNPGRFWYANLMMGAHVLELSREHGLGKLVIAGTVCAYPKFAPVPFREDDLWNGYPEETNAPYGVAKKSILVGAQSYREQYGLDSIFLLPANLYGPRDNFDLETSHVIPGLIRKMLDNSGRVTLWGDGSPTREFLYVDDCVEGLVLAAERYDGAEPVNLGTGVEISIASWRSRSQSSPASKARSSGTRRCRTASRDEASTQAGPESSSASRHVHRYAKGSSGRSPGTASTPARPPAAQA